VIDELEWCQGQSNAPGKGEHVTSMLHQITSSQVAISTQVRVLRLCEQSKGGDRTYLWKWVLVKCKQRLNRRQNHL